MRALLALDLDCGLHGVCVEELGLDGFGTDFIGPNKL